MQNKSTLEKEETVAVAIDSKMRLRRYNRGGESWFGLRPDDIGKPVARIDGLRLLANVQRSIRSAIRGRKTVILQAEHRRRPGVLG